jgi:hypothetical protein
MTGILKEVSGVQQKELAFPKLMLSDSGSVVLFTERERGTVLVAGENLNPLGTYNQYWGMEYFKDLPTEQVVELSN